MRRAASPASRFRHARRHWWRSLAPACLLLLMFAAQITTLPVTSPTYDEHEYVTRGYTYLQTGNTSLKLRHPILLDLLAAAPLRLMPGLRVPLEAPSLAAGEFHSFSRLFFWEVNGDRADQMIWLARLAPLSLSLCLAALVFTWARQRFGLVAGLAAMALTVLDPTILAHGRLVTPDVGQAFFFMLAAFGWWYYWQRPTPWRLAGAGVALGLAQVAGFPGLILYPILAVAGLFTAFPALPARGAGAWWRQVWQPYLLVVAVSLLVVWAVYGFRWGVVSGLGAPLPAPYHWEEFLSLLQRLGRQDLAYFQGEVYRGGRWPFFILALLVKSPLPTLLLAAVGILLWGRSCRRRSDAALWLFPLVYYAVAVGGNLNLGFRHLLPVLPYLFLLGGAAVAGARHQAARWAVGGLLLWLAFGSGRIYPYYLAFFNEAAGGPVAGRHALVVSDLDWGQDLVGLQHYLDRAQPAEPVYLSYFGTTPPAHYGIDYRPLPAWPPRGLPGELPFHPAYPLPGLYAISVANLVGARFEEAPDTFAWFWNQEPVARIGYSIDVYRVPRLLSPGAPAVNLVLGDVPLPALPASFIADRLRTNDLAPRWTDPDRALLLPAAGGLLITRLDSGLHPALAAMLGATPEPPLAATDGRPLQVTALPPAAAMTRRLTTETGARLEDGRWLDTPIAFADTLVLLGYDVEPAPGALQLVTAWQVTAPPPAPLTFFVHLLAEAGEIVAQDDGVGVRPATWRAGDLLLQRHWLPLPADSYSQQHTLALGAYRRDTLERLPLAAGGDRLLLHPDPEHETNG